MKGTINPKGTRLLTYSSICLHRATALQPALRRVLPKVVQCQVLNR